MLDYNHAHSGYRDHVALGGGSKFNLDEKTTGEFVVIALSDLFRHMSFAVNL